MKKIDQIILLIIVAVTIILLCYGLTFYLPMLLKTLAVILGTLYGFFLLMHMGLCYPLFAICMTIIDNTRDSSILKTIESKSLILHALTNIVMYVAVLALIYVGVPLIIAMLVNCDINIYYAFESLNLWLRT
tara:strand:+ start:515 stop:910 length:396 start_codon:yes stop_codon:yes gene_type:complete